MSGSVTVAFDEAGNTGQDLLHPDQPMFVMSSVCFDANTAAGLARTLLSSQAREVKFTSLRKTARGRAKVLALLESEKITSETVKLYPMHKEFLVSTKIADLLVEKVTRQGGLDFYERGANLAYANLLHLALPTFVGKPTAAKFRAEFVTMIRKRDAGAADDFYRTTELIYHSLDAVHGSNSSLFFAPILASRRIISEVLESCSSYDLDPVIPAFVSLCDAWGKQLGTRFGVDCDESKAIAADQAILLALSHPEEPETEVGYDRRKMVFPLKIAQITLKNSVASSSIQIADVMAGSLCYALTKNMSDAGTDDFARRIFAIVASKELGVDACFPTPDVTPETLGMSEAGGSNAAEHAAGILHRRLRRTR